MIIKIYNLDEINIQTIELIFENNFNKQIENKLLKLNCLKYLTFGRSFNCSVQYLPCQITHLIFGNNFNQNVDNLPDELTHLTFGNDFDKPVLNLPTKLIYLVFGNNFNQSVDYLPSGIKHIVFGSGFNENIDNLPSNLESIVLGKKFNRSLNNLPQQLTHLSFELVGLYENILQLPKKLSWVRIINDNIVYTNDFLLNINRHIDKHNVKIRNRNLLQGPVGAIGPTGAIGPRGPTGAMGYVEELIATGYLV
jgi:hypothetical protein